MKRFYMLLPRFLIAHACAMAVALGCMAFAVLKFGLLASDLPLWYSVTASLLLMLPYPIVGLLARKHCAQLKPAACCLAGFVAFAAQGVLLTLASVLPDNLLFVIWSLPAVSVAVLMEEAYGTMHLQSDLLLPVLVAALQSILFIGGLLIPRRNGEKP
ncbi:MAG: hypothetical protein RR606_07810 [Oscillospiraceae bacterium]